MAPWPSLVLGGGAVKTLFTVLRVFENGMIVPVVRLMQHAPEDLSQLTTLRASNQPLV
jgi:hypothetical protein